MPRYAAFRERRKLRAELLHCPPLSGPSLPTLLLESLHEEADPDTEVAWIGELGRRPLYWIGRGT